MVGLIDKDWEGHEGPPSANLYASGCEKRRESRESEDQYPGQNRPRNSAQNCTIYIDEAGSGREGSLREKKGGGPSVVCLT